jgi:Asp-tRNA(Asn)/Glu-tRNA(Gln) amidotransferase A subunit family amidase
MGDHAIFTRFVNYLGLPATAFPVGFSHSGLPVGAQLVGRPFADMFCLSVVQAYQDATAHHLRRSALWVGGD